MELVLRDGLCPAVWACMPAKVRIVEDIHFVGFSM